MVFVPVNHASAPATPRCGFTLAGFNAARYQPSDVTRALALAATASTDPTPDEPGVFGFATGKAAYYAHEAHRELGGTDHLDAAVDWALNAVDEFTAEPRPNIAFIAAAHIDLASAHLARDDLDAVREQLAPVLRSTQAEYRTVSVINRARSLNMLLTQRPDLASSTLTALRDDLTEFWTHPAPTPAGVEPGSTT